MNVQVLGCSHRNTPIALREQLAFGAEKAQRALLALHSDYPQVEIVLLSTCNRVEFYFASERGRFLSQGQGAEFLARFHGLHSDDLIEHLYEREGAEAVRHLFIVASSLDSMVVGEPQILAQVKNAYKLAMEQKATGPLTHATFQAAVRVARRIMRETTIHQRKVSIPSVGVSDFAQQIFDRFDNKQVLVIGAGEMAVETLKYLRKEGARHITVVNRSRTRAEQLAQQWNGSAQDWDCLDSAMVTADLIISTTGSTQPIVSLARFAPIELRRCQRPLFILDLAVPRDFDPAIGKRPGVYLYSVDDLQHVCERNRSQRDKELPLAMRIIDEETERFTGELRRRSMGPVVQKLREGFHKSKDIELQRLLQKLPQLDESSRREIDQAFDRLLGKLLNTPMQSLRQASAQGTQHVLLSALSKLFWLKD